MNILKRSFVDSWEHLAKLWRFRSLLIALVGRHLKSRYRGSILGFIWTLLNPLLQITIYTIVFRYYMRFGEIPNYTVFLLCGLLPWQWSVAALAEGASAIVGNSHFVTKALFPAQLLPASVLLTNLTNFLLSLPILLLFLFFTIGASWQILFLPVLIFLQLLFLYGLVLLTASLNVSFRDTQHLVGHMTMFLFFLTPIIYSAQTVPERFRGLLKINPFTIFISSYHALLYDSAVVPLSSWAAMSALSLLFLLIGLLVFERLREGFAESL
ncbi:MAG TPA: ABC transporter permease [Oligoflexia bacterium]|nr:ABC transporter permease [Oligoflexia bacterium]HMP26425.1 ABC transporter permease [Oligoflexia bacterium]